MPADARFCEMCGAAIFPLTSSTLALPETIIGHIPVGIHESEKGFFRRHKITNFRLIIGFLLHPNDLMQKQATQAGWLTIFAVPASAFALFFLQTGIDQMRQQPALIVANQREMG